MVEFTLSMPEKLAARLQPMGGWIPTIIELGLVGYRTLATETASEVIAFLSASPTPQEVLGYHASQRSQLRLQRLLALNEAGLLGAAEQHELDELQEIEHILIMLKAEIGRSLHRATS